MNTLSLSLVSFINLSTSFLTKSDFQMSSNAWVSNGRDKQQPFTSPSEAPPSFNLQEVRDCLKNGIFTDIEHMNYEGLICISNQEPYT